MAFVSEVQISESRGEGRGSLYRDRAGNETAAVDMPLNP
jgi:hypothetical protein